MKKKPMPEWQHDEILTSKLVAIVDGFPEKNIFKKLKLKYDSIGWFGNITGFRIDSVSKHYAHEHKSSHSIVGISDTLLKVTQGAINKWFKGLKPLWTIRIGEEPLMVMITFDEFAYLRGCANIVENKRENFIPKVSDKE